jgi:hypothetical protein
MTSATRPTPGHVLPAPRAARAPENRYRRSSRAEYTRGARRTDPGIRTVLAIPMLRGSELLGIISIYCHEVLPFTDRQIALMESFADFDDPFHTQLSGLDPSFWQTPILERLAGLLLSPGRSLLVYSPVVTLSALGMVRAWLPGGNRLLRTLRVGAVLTILLYSKWTKCGAPQETRLSAAPR